MVTYVRNDRNRIFQPDRRSHSAAPPDGVERRSSEPTRTTSDQYGFLRDCLVRRETTRAKIAVDERRARHLLATASFIFIALYVAPTDFNVLIPFLKSKQTITLLQLGVITPFILTWLVLHAYDRAKTRQRPDHECWILDRELRRFGCPSSYQALGGYEDYCDGEVVRRKHRLTSHIYHLTFWLRDFYLASLVALSFGGAWFVAVRLFAEMSQRRPHSAVGFFLLLGIAGLVCVGTPILFFILRKRKEDLAKDYLKQLDAKG